MRELGWSETPVTVADSVQDELTALYAERDENTQREDFSPAEMVVHSRRIEDREREVAKQRQREHGGTAPGRSNTSANLAEVFGVEPAHERQSRYRVAKAVGTSHGTLSKAKHVIDTAEDPATPPEVAEVAQKSAENLAQPGAVVDREHRAVREAEQAHAEKAITDAIDERLPGTAPGTVGVLNPPTVRCVAGEWVLIGGVRRLAAMRELGWSETPVTVADSVQDELTALYAERDENTQREDFSPAEMVVHSRRIEDRERHRHQMGHRQTPSPAVLHTIAATRATTPS